MNTSLEQLSLAHIEFTLGIFKESTAASSIAKLKGEADEVLQELELGDPANEKARDDLAEEYADCFMCLFDSMARASVSVDQMKEAFHKKIQKNKSRTWVKNPDNTYSHIK